MKYLLILILLMSCAENVKHTSNIDSQIAFCKDRNFKVIIINDEQGNPLGAVCEVPWGGE